MDSDHPSRPLSRRPVYRKMLDEQKGIDAVVVVTPDDVHAFASFAAAAV